MNQQTVEKIPTLYESLPDEKRELYKENFDFINELKKKLSDVQNEGKLHELTKEAIVFNSFYKIKDSFKKKIN